MPIDKITAKEKRYPRPKNCGHMTVPMVNKEISLKQAWKAGISDLWTLDFVQMATVAILPLDHANTSLSLQRRLLLKSVLKGTLECVTSVFPSQITSLVMTCPKLSKSYTSLIWARNFVDYAGKTTVVWAELKERQQLCPIQGQTATLTIKRNK